jgi:TRAP-type C4-dicarboxylate transport system permease large subunit
LKQFWQTNKKWIDFFKIVLSIVVISFVIYKLLNAYQIDEKFVQFQFNFTRNNILLLTLTILLLFVNVQMAFVG